MLRSGMQSGMNPDEKTRGIPFVLLADLLLLLMAVLAGGAALRESVTVDEVSHIGTGVSYLQKLDLRMNPEHPPLPKVLAAIPLVLRGVRADYTHISWTFSEKFFPAYVGQWVFGVWLLEKWNEPKMVLAWARFPMLLLTLALGWAVYACAKRLGGAWGGLLCLAVYVSTPAFLTFGPLVHTDLAVTLFSLLSLWAFAELWQEPNRKNALLFGLCLAGALLSKFTAGVLYAALAVYAFYFVFSLHQPTNALYRIGDGPLALFLRRLLLPPLLYLRGLFLVVFSSRRPTFILGHSYPHGVWFYFPIVFVLKSSLGYLSLLFLAVVAALIRKVNRKLNRKARGETTVPVISPQRAEHWRVLWVSLLVFTGVCLLSPLDISIRRFSGPIMPLILMLAPLPRLLGELRARTALGARLGAAAIAALAVSCLFTAVRAYPYYFPYINALSLGRPAYALVNDSNVDWNQSLPEVQRFAEQHRLQRIGLDDYGFSDPTVFVPQAQPCNCQRPEPGDAGQWVALSANNILDGHNCAWLTQYPHEALAGGSIHAVQLPAPIPVAGSVGGPPMPSDYRQFGGAPLDIRGFFKHVIQHPDDLPQA